MAAIRPLERDDLPAVAALIRDNLGWRRDAHVLERTLVEHPWAPAELPSLVAVDDSGQIIGSIGAQARRLRFEDSELLGVCVSHLVVDSSRRAGAAGALLVRALLAQGQDLTWTDSGTEDVVRIWRTFGAHADHSRNCNWMLVLRPMGWMARIAGRRLGASGLARHAMPVRALPLQAAGRRLMPRAFPETSADVMGADAPPTEIAELLPTLTRDFRLRVDYDAGYLSWVFHHVSSLGAPVLHRLVRRGGAPIGWYAYIRQDGVSRVIHLAARAPEVDAVFGELVAHAREGGSALLAGRLEPHLEEPLRRRFAAVGLAQRPIAHARDPELRAMLASTSSLITEMDLIDSEWW
jgi:hypothetical protein